MLAAALPADAPPSDVSAALSHLLTNDFRFSTSDLADLGKGEVVAHRLGATAYGEAGAVGAVRIAGRKETFVDLYRNIEQFKRGPGVMSIGMFGNPPSVADLASLMVNLRDMNLRECRVGDCDVRLPASDIERIRREVDWNAPDADARAFTLFKEIFAGYVRDYVAGDPNKLVQYDDDPRPVRPQDDFSALVEHSPYLDRLAPGLSRHFEAYPKHPLPDVEDFVYWSVERFGRLAPFISATHVAITQPEPSTVVIASKDVYSSRYFDASLSFTIAADAVSLPGSFYLVYANRSRADALKGSLAGLRRSIVERRSKGSIEDHLKAMKQQLEKGS